MLNFLTFVRLKKNDMRLFLTLLAILISLTMHCQEKLGEGILLQVENRQIPSQEFIDVFTKNASIIAEEEKITVDEYLELFKKYQLKLQAAYDQQIDTVDAFQKEYQKYYKQLADNYIANGEVTEEMVKETYRRLETEVKASHILINVKPNATEEELQAAYEKASSLRNQLQNGADFETLAVENSNDPSVNNNKGNLGWFKGFKMVLPFEEATYSMNVGDISEPVRTQFGYHIILKTGERTSVGKIKVAHIMIRHQQNDTLVTPEQKIQEIYQKIEAGEDFANLAKQFSQDENTASNGGEMSPFELGSINSPKFEEVVFDLANDGQVSEPFQTRFGWHIAKRLGTEPLASLEEQKQTLKQRIKTSDRVKLLNSKIQEKIETYYKVVQNDDAIDYLAEKIDESILKYKWKKPENMTIPQEIFLQIDNTLYSWEDLANYVEKQQRAAKNTFNALSMVQELADNFVYTTLVEYHKKMLPQIDYEFASSVKEYKNGLMLYEIMQQKVWNAAKEDSIAVKNYFENHATNYTTNKSIDVEMVNFRNKKDAKSFLKQLTSKEEFAKLVSSFPDAVLQEKEVKEVTSPSISPKLKMEEGVSKIYTHNGQYVIYHIHQVLPVRQQALEEVKGKVISDYQDKLENDWLIELRNKYELVINEDELTKIKNKFE